MITEYEKSLEQIAAGLAHEVKNPLSLVKANVDLLELMDENKVYSKNYNIMRQELEKINELIMDFIQFAKPIKNDMQKVDILESLENIVDSIKVTYGNNFSININSSGDYFSCLCDENKINRVFINIIKNSIEALPDINGMIDIDISENKNYIKIVISDNGSGIDMSEDLDITSPFYTTKKTGSGLGLYISRSIINEHNGLFEIIGKNGEGCKVTIMLPSL